MSVASWTPFYLECLALGLSLLVLAAGWREAPAADRPRYQYIVPALLLIVTLQILTPLVSLTGEWDPTKNPIVLAVNVLPLVGLLLLSYAVLRHRVIDLGFAVNRTLVYATVSAMMLAVFGLTEWAVDHFVPIKGREKNALVDAYFSTAGTTRTRKCAGSCTKGRFSANRWRFPLGSFRLWPAIQVAPKLHYTCVMRQAMSASQAKFPGSRHTCHVTCIRW